MASNINTGSGVNNAYLMQQMKDVKNSGVKAAQTNVASGNTAVSKQSTESNKGVKEESSLSEAARKAIEQGQLKEASDKGGAQNAGKAASQKKAKEREKTKGDGDIRGADNGKFYKIPDTAKPGDVLPTEDGGAIVVGDMDSGVEPSKLSRGQAERFHYLDSEANIKAQKDGTPNAEVTGKMAEPQVGNKEGRKKLAKELKNTAECDEKLTKMELKLTHKQTGCSKTGPAGIKTPKDEGPLNIADEHAEGSVMEAAKLEARNGGGAEAFVA